MRSLGMTQINKGSDSVKNLFSTMRDLKVLGICSLQLTIRRVHVEYTSEFFAPSAGR